MPENKNQSYANWPSVSGSRTTGGIDLRGLNPVMAQRREMLRAYQQRLAGDVAATRQVADINSRFTKITQDLGASSIARQEQLVASRQANHQRMMELYGNYFQQFGNVLNKDALDFLDQHSNIKVPTLTAIMAGYEHARASQAEQQLAMLDRQAKMAEAQYALDKQAADLQTLKEANDALLQQQNLKNQADAVTAINKSQSQYLTDVAEKVYGGRGVAGGRGTGVAGAGGLGGSSAAGSFQAPVTGGGGTGAVAGGGATGFVDPSNPQVAALNKMIDDSKAAQTAGQVSQLGPLAMQARGDVEGITQWSDLDNIWTRGVALGGTYLGGKYLTASGNRVNPALTKTLTDSEKLLTGLKSDRKSLAGNIKLQEGKYLTAQSNALKFENTVLRYAQTKDSARFLQAGNDLDRYIEIVKNSKMSNTDKKVVDMYNKSKTLTTEATKIGKQLDNLRGIYDVNKISVVNAENAVTGAKSAIDASKNSVRKIVARGAGKLLSKAALPLTIVDTVLNYGDEVFGAGAAGLQWLGDRVSDLTGFTTPEEAKNRPTIIQRYNENRDAFLAAQNQFFNTISGGRLNVALEDADVQQAVGRLRELGWGGEGSDWRENNFNIHQLMQMKRNDPDSFYKALDALYQYDPQINGNISPLEYFNRAASKAAFDRTYATQVNKAAQNQQLTNQQVAEETEKANMIDPRTHRFLAAMMKHYTDMGRQAGYDFHEGHAIQFANAYMQFVADMESGNKQGAVGSMTSTGTAKSRYQFMDKTFQSAVQWMLDEDEKAGNQLLNSNEREILREARTKDANFLDNNGYGNLLGFMTLLYPLKSSVSASKFGSGNPDITGQQMVVDMIQQFKNGGGMTPYLLSNMGAAYSGALHGRMGKKEYANNQNRVTALIQSMYGPDHAATGVYMPNAQIGEFLGNQGIQWDMRYDPVVWRNQWVAENFDKNEKGDDLVPKSTYKPYEQWKIDNGLNQVRQVGKPEQITMSQYIKRLNDKVDFDNLDPLVKRQLNAMAEEVGKYGRSVQLNSGRRDPAKNDELIRRWGSGDREGMVHKPSKNSKHLIGTAFDMQRSGPNGLDEIVNNTPELKQKYGDARGMMAAYGFDNNVKNDPVHFSLNEDFRKNNSRSSGWTLPSVASLPFAPVEYPEVVVEPANQGIVDPLDLSAFDGMMPGGVNFSPTNYGVAMEQMQQQYPQEGYIDESMITW